MKTLNEARAEVVELATSKYLEGLNLMQSTLCLGWEAKVKKGAYGQNNHDAHKEANLAFGAHYGIHEAIKLLDEPLKAQEGQIATLQAELQQSREALKMVKVRVCFIGWPREPMVDRGDGVMCPDWRKECQAIEAALYPSTATHKKEDA